MIGVALSGGGARAMAFHLGCLRALHEMGILERVRVISTISGGSVIGALYAAREEPFEVFETRVRERLRCGFLWPTVRMSFARWESLGMLALRPVLVVLGLLLWVLERAFWLIAWVLPRDRWGRRHALHIRSPIRRSVSRTTMLRRFFGERLFDGERLADLPDTRPLLIVNAAELRTGSAFYFSKLHSGTWRMGTIAASETTLAQAVTASTAHLAFLPALDERIAFDRRDGSRQIERVVLVDGGVYDNTALAPLWPDRDLNISLPFSSVDTIIACRTGYGLRFDRPALSPLARLESTIACIGGRAENASVKRMFEMRKSGAQRICDAIFGAGRSHTRMPSRRSSKARGYLWVSDGLLCNSQVVDRPPFAA